MVKDHLTAKMGVEPILAVRWSVTIATIIKLNGDSVEMCKQALARSHNPVLTEVPFANEFVLGTAQVVGVNLQVILLVADKTASIHVIYNMPTFKVAVLTWL